MIENPKVGMRVVARFDERMLRHLARERPEFAALGELRGGWTRYRGVILEVDPRGTARVAFDPQPAGWRLVVPLEDLTEEPGDP